MRGTHCFFVEIDFPGLLEAAVCIGVVLKKDFAHWLEIGVVIGVEIDVEEESLQFVHR